MSNAKNLRVQTTACLVTDEGTRTVTLTPQIVAFVPAGEEGSTYHNASLTSIKPGGFGEVAKKRGPKVAFDVPNRLSSDDNALLHVEVLLNCPPSEWPARIVESVPALKERADLRAGLLELVRFLKLNNNRPTKALINAFLASPPEQLDAIQQELSEREKTSSDAE